MARYAAATAQVAHDHVMRSRPAQARRRRRVERRIPWPGDVTPDAIILPSLEDIPEWINGPRSRVHKTLAIVLAATLTLDLTYLMMYVSG